MSGIGTGTCDCHPGVHEFRNDPDPCIGWADIGLTITVTRSGGKDQAVIVFIDTQFEPDASDGSPGLRVMVNDSTVFEGKAFESVMPWPAAESVALEVSLKDIDYTGEMIG